MEELIAWCVQMQDAGKDYHTALALFRVNKGQIQTKVFKEAWEGAKKVERL